MAQKKKRQIAAKSQEQQFADYKAAKKGTTYNYAQDTNFSQEEMGQFMDTNPPPQQVVQPGQSQPALGGQHIHHQ